ncbi:MAG: DNA polymerase III subunit delta [Wolbachia endosymbiont of Meromenopon meropis]|nr:DNA polymerase III subunit delta [Wolbachia endosymbiont of Meromenopon meropis]
MKLISSKIKKFLEKPYALHGVLIYGNDNSRIDFFTRAIITSLIDYSIRIIDFTTVNKSPGLLLSELVNISMFTDKKIIKIINVSGNISQELKILLNQNTNRHFIMMIANDPLCNSEVKNYMESSKIFGVIACYKDIDSNLYDIISNYLKQNNVQYTSEAIYHLQYYFNHSKLFICSELKKLLLYLGERKNLNSSDVKLCFPIFNKDYVTLDNLCSAIVEKNTVDFIKISDILISQDNFSSIALIRIMLNYFLRIENALLLIQSGISEQAAINQVNPPLFFKQLQNFKFHLRSFQLIEVKSILERLIRLEILCKKTDLDCKMIFQHVLQIIDT